MQRTESTKVGEKTEKVDPFVILAYNEILRKTNEETNSFNQHESPEEMELVAVASPESISVYKMLLIACIDQKLENSNNPKLEQIRKKLATKDSFSMGKLKNKQTQLKTQFGMFASKKNNYFDDDGNILNLNVYLTRNNLKRK